MLTNVFQNLNRWRHLPAYQLERRADIFFSVYLKDVVENFTGTALEDIIIPELPIKRKLVDGKGTTNLSVKVDYALFSKDRSVVYFIELKTDMNSRRDGQDDYLLAAEALGFESIVAGVKDIFIATKAYQKYYHLVSIFADLGFMKMPDDIESYLYPKPKRGLTEKLNAIEIRDLSPRVEVIYVQPTKTDDKRCIDFERFAAYVSIFDDEMSKHFAESLSKWKEPAGCRAEG